MYSIILIELQLISKLISSVFWSSPLLNIRISLGSREQDYRPKTVIYLLVVSNLLSALDPSAPILFLCKALGEPKSKWTIELWSTIASINMAVPLFDRQLFWRVMDTSDLLLLISSTIISAASSPNWFYERFSMKKLGALSSI